MHSRGFLGLLTRLMFPLAELDDTSRPEGEFPIFGFKLSPRQID
jgi:hypothetical protein